MERERKIKRAKEREKNEGRLEESSLVLSRSLPSFFPALSLALHYLNAWNRLNVMMTDDDVGKLGFHCR